MRHLFSLGGGGGGIFGIFLSVKDLDGGDSLGHFLLRLGSFLFSLSSLLGRLGGFSLGFSFSLGRGVLSFLLSLGGFSLGSLLSLGGFSGGSLLSLGGFSSGSLLSLGSRDLFAFDSRGSGSDRHDDRVLLRNLRRFDNLFDHVRLSLGIWRTARFSGNSRKTTDEGADETRRQRGSGDELSRKRKLAIRGLSDVDDARSLLDDALASLAGGAAGGDNGGGFDGIGRRHALRSGGGSLTSTSGALGGATLRTEREDTSDRGADTAGGGGVHRGGRLGDAVDNALLRTLLGFTTNARDESVLIIVLSRDRRRGSRKRRRSVLHRRRLDGRRSRREVDLEVIRKVIERRRERLRRLGRRRLGGSLRRHSRRLRLDRALSRSRRNALGRLRKRHALRKRLSRTRDLRRRRRSLSRFYDALHARKHRHGYHRRRTESLHSLSRAFNLVFRVFLARVSSRRRRSRRPSVGGSLFCLN